MTTPLIRADTTINTNVRGSKVFALAFVKTAGVTDVFTEDQIREFVLPKLGETTLLGSAIVQLDSVSSGKDFHSGRGDEAFTGLLTKVFSNGVVSGATTENPSDLADGINVYFMTMDGLNETAVRGVLSLMSVNPPTEGLALWIDPDAYTSGDILDTISGNAVSPAYAPEDYTVAGYKTVKAWNYSTTAPTSAGTALATPRVVSTTGGFTFARWVHWESGITTWRRLFVDYSSNWVGAWYLTAKDGTDFFANYTHSVGDIRPNTSSAAVDIDYSKWQLAIAVGNANGFNTLYLIDVNEALSDTTLPSYVAVPANAGHYNTEIHFSHMTENGGSLAYPMGWIGDTYVYNKELTQTEVFELWNATRNKYN